MKKKTLFVILFLAVCAILAVYSYNIRGLYPYTQEYIAGKGNIKGNVNIDFLVSESPEFDIGANIFGYAVFKNPKKAFKVFVEKYASGIELIQEEYDLAPLTAHNYKSYKTYGWQTGSGTEEEKRQSRFVSSFFDIYENSFE